MSAAKTLATVGVALEAVGVLALAVWETFALITTGAGSVVNSVALIVFTALGAVLIGVCAWGIAQNKSMARSGGVVVQLLLLAVAFGAATGEFAQWGIAVALAVPAIAIGALILVTARQAALQVTGEDEAGDPPLA